MDCVLLERAGRLSNLQALVVLFFILELCVRGERAGVVFCCTQVCVDSRGVELERSVCFCCFRTQLRVV